MRETLLVGGRALLGDGTLVRADVRVRDGVVVELGDGLRPAARSDVVEVAGFTMPGLVDAHAHVAWAGVDPMPSTVEGVRARVDVNLRSMLRSGVTTVREVGSIGGLAIDAVGGPDMWSAGRIVCAVGGHGTETAEGWGELPPQTTQARGPDAFRAAVRAQVARGARLVKVTLNAARLEVDETEAAAVVDEARRLGVRVAAHASIPEAIDLAIAVGADTIEHGNGATPAQLARMADGGIVLVPTVWIYRHMLDVARAAEASGTAGSSWPPPTDVWQSRVDAHRDVVRDAVAAGVTLAAGTDAIEGCRADALADELHALHALGLDAVAALRAATVGGAAALGVHDAGADGVGVAGIGVLAEGVRADLVAFDAAPDDVVAGRLRPTVVLHRGRRVR